MDTTTLQITLKTCLRHARAKLDQAASIAQAADACAEAGFGQKAVEITLDIDQPLYEATTLLNAASLLNRLGRTE